MYKTNCVKYLLLLALLAVTDKAAAVDYCVYNNIGLQIALDTASNNNQADHIMIKKGNYVYPVSNQFFRYEADAGEFHDLTISGGWMGGTLTTCSFQSREIYSTTIDGDNQVRGLLIEPDSSARIEITDLNFINGYVTGGNEGGGLLIDTENNDFAEVLVERNTFSNNYATVGGAYSQRNGYRIEFKNNLVINNHSENGAAVNIENRNQQGIYVINNTVINNTTDSTASFHSSGVYIFVSAPSEAFIANNILWGNQINDIWFLGYEHLYHNNIGSQTAPADVNVGNISVTPDFFPNGVYGTDFTPKHNSALHNSGYLLTFINVPPWFEEDWDHGDYDVTGRNVRIRESLVDIGAFETPPDYPIFANGFECENETRGFFNCGPL